MKNRKLVLIILSIILSLGIFELFLRLKSSAYVKFANSSYEYYTNPRDYYIPVRKEGKLTVYSLDYKQNRLGYRIKGEKIADLKNDSIIALGDSFTYGRGVKYDDIYLSKLEKISGLSAKNCATVGADIDKIYATYIHETQAIKYPVVIYGFVLNDFGLPGVNIRGNNFIDLNNNGYRYDPIRSYSAIYNFIMTLYEKRKLSRITTKAYLEAFKGKNAESKFRVLKRLNEVVKADNSQLIVVLFPLLYDFKNYPFLEIHETIRNFCRNEGILLTDLLEPFSEYTAEKLWAAPTDYHPNEIAHNIAAERVSSLIKKLK